MKIFLIVVCSLVGLYLILKIVGFIFVAIFKKILKKHNKGLVVVLKTKYDNIYNIYNILKQLKVNIDSSYFDKLNSIKIEDFENQQSIQCKSSKEIMSFLRDEALFIIKKDENLMKHELIKKWKENLKDVDVLYRNHIAEYNADVLGYNYWIHFLPNRLFFKIIKSKPKDIIS